MDDRSDKVDVNQYINSRLDDQIKWYSKKSSHCKNWHDILSIISIIGTSSSALLSAASSSFPDISKIISIIAAIIAFLVTIVLSIDKLKKYQELHHQYRSTCEKLKQEKYLFITRSGEYNQLSEPSIEQLFIERCESIMSSETVNWAHLIEKKS